MFFLRSILLTTSAFTALITAAPLTGQRDASFGQIPGKWIVTYRTGIDIDAHTTWLKGLQKRTIGERSDTSVGILSVYTAFPAYVGLFDDATIEVIKKSPDVVAVEQDRSWHLSRTASPKPLKSRALVTQGSVGWNLAAISHRSRGATNYVYDSSAGAGTYVYVLATAIYLQHAEFEGRASFGYSAVPGGSATDGNGIGTHLAGVACGKTYGVAKKCSPIAVRVLDDQGSGSYSWILDGINWAVNDIKSKGRANKSNLLLPLGGSYSAAINNAVTSAFNNGVLSVCVAGNQNQDVANTSPGSTPQCLTVGAVGQEYSRTSSSNYGSGIDVFAPGQNIVGPWIGSTTATNTLSGSSVAAAHVSGLAAYLQALENLVGPQAVVDRILALATNGVVGNPGNGSPNKLIYNGSGA